MCVLAAYLGPEPAAPILLDMLAREEGIGGGYYTGLATIHGGQLHCEKIVGDVARLRRETDAEQLPGTIGIAHSRTPSGGDREWAHPFVGNTGRIAYVANGAMGAFRVDAHEPPGKTFGDMLLQKGAHFRSGAMDAVGGYPTLANGQCVHFSETMCLLIEDLMREGRDLLHAAARAYQQWPAEIVGMAISADDPSHVVAVRINQPLVIGRRGDAIYAATTSLAFPPGVEWSMTMPAHAAAHVGREAITVLPFASHVPVADMPPLDAVCQVLLPALHSEPQTIGALCELTNDLWAPGQLPQKAMLVYELVGALVAAGRAELVTETVPGMFGEGTAPRTTVKWVKANG